MAKESIYDGVATVVYISSNIMEGCKECGTTIDGGEFAESVDHYISKHGYKLLHVGTETSRSSEGSPWHSTIAVLGK